SSFSAMKSSGIVALAATVAQVTAHGFVQGIDIAGTYGYLVNNFPYATSPPSVIGWAETATDLGFVAPSAFTTGDIICHKGGANAKKTATVAAGGTVRMDWNTWPESHHGPVIDYMANCNGDCTTVDKATLEFFKIAEKGLVDNSAAPGTWASDELITNNNSWAITIPSTLAAGNYVLRHEIIALHSAGSADGAQNYPQCINLEVTGSGTEAPTGTLGTDLYTETDQGILVSIYTVGLDYVIPGPALAFGASSGSSGSASSASAPVATAATPTTLATIVHSTAAAAPTAVAEEEGDTC
ncbi:glycosyl hydrolase family 61-domain-containing protein, partial [Amylocarpus encephaloides]